MIIIADSGSTKCDWALIDEKGMRMDDFQTMGLNPYFHSPDVIEKAIKDNAPFYALADQIKHIFSTVPEVALPKCTLSCAQDWSVFSSMQRF